MSTELIRKTAPCSCWDMEGMQTWLEDMAMEGFLLEKQSFFGNVFLFHTIEPLEIRYRLTPVSNRLEEWNQAPDPEPRSIADAYGWDYVCTLGYFHVYRAYDPECRELNTDPAVHAEALTQLRRKSVRAACMVLIAPLTYFAIVWLFSGPNMLWRTVVRDAIILYSLLPLLVVFMTVRGIHDTVALLRLQRRWQRGQLPVERKDWRKNARTNRIVRGAVYVLPMCLIVLSSGYRFHMREQMHYQDLPETADVPFATVMELAAEAGMDAERHEVGFLREWSHVLSSVNYEWAEIVDVTAADGTVGRVSIDVCYHELANEWLAEQLAGEYLAEAIDVGTPVETADDERFDLKYCYLDDWGCPAAVLRRGNVVVQVSFPRLDIEDPYMDLKHWVACLETE